MLNANCKNMQPVLSTDSPVIKQPHDSSPVLNETPVKSPECITQQGLVLVVEDDDDIRDAVVTCVSIYGYNTMAASTRDQAVHMMSCVAPDVILMDFAMPGMTMQDFLEIVKKMNPVPSVILMTAFSNVIERAHKLGINYSISKPFDTESIKGVIQKCLKP